jgi:hypothetical protein
MFMAIYSTETTEFEGLGSLVFLLTKYISLINYRKDEEDRLSIPEGIARRVKYPTKRPRKPITVLIRPNAIAIAISEETKYE